jgi:NAD(P)-dependent dehydrogenase (short-subunit alcohol dehydrogenase family)
MYGSAANEPVYATKMALPLESKTALVTGAARGIGKRIALELARAGCNVAINDLSAGPEAQAVVAEIAEMGRKSIAIAADVGNAAEVGSMFEEISSRLGPIDILVNNAGTQVWKPLLELEEAEWDRVIDTNLKGCFLCTQQAARRMKNSGGGRIVNIGSGCNKIAFPNLVSYTASKGGIEMFTRVAALELGKYGIAVNCVAPGAIEVERTRLEAPDFAGTWAAVTPLGRVGEPLDVARAVLFFAGEAASFVSGQTLWVDGGLFTHPIWPYPSGS